MPADIYEFLGLRSDVSTFRDERMALLWCSRSSAKFFLILIWRVSVSLLPQDCNTVYLAIYKSLQASIPCFVISRLAYKYCNANGYLRVSFGLRSDVSTFGDDCTATSLSISKSLQASIWCINISRWVHGSRAASIAICYFLRASKRCLDISRWTVLRCQRLFTSFCGLRSDVSTFQDERTALRQDPCILASLPRHQYYVLSFRDERIQVLRCQRLFTSFFGLRSDVSTLRDERFPGIDTIFRYFEIIVQLCSSIPGYLFLRASIRCFDISARLYGSISG